MYIKRTAEKMILEISRSFPCIVLYGPRQVGKSTTIQMLFGEKYRIVTLDDGDDRNLAINNPRLFLETYGWPLVIDEIQKAPGLLDEIKKIIDVQRLLWLKENKDRELMYILTGSNRFELQEGISESLAGRCGIIEMSSFSMVEKHQKTGQPFAFDVQKLLLNERSSNVSYIGKHEIFREIFEGSMPDVCTGNSERDNYYRSYISTYIEKDVRKLIEAASEPQFRSFLSIVALRTAQELHMDEIASSVGIDVRTGKRWLSILELSGIVYLLQPYMPNLSKRIIKAPKLYFMDTGLCAYLCKWPNEAMLESCAMSGAFFETFVVSELIKNMYAYNKDPDDYLFYYRDIDKKEVDILYVEENTIFPIEIKKGESPTKPTKNFNVLEKYKIPVKPGLIIDNCEKIRPVNDFAWFYPVSHLGM